MGSASNRWMLDFPRGGGLIRVFIDKVSGVRVEDCAAVSNHLTRLFAVEAVEYSRLEVSSPGLDRPLRQLKDFRRFEGERAQVRMRVPVQGRKNFIGILRGASDAEVKLRWTAFCCPWNLPRLKRPG